MLVRYILLLLFLFSCTLLESNDLSESISSYARCPEDIQVYVKNSRSSAKKSDGAILIIAKGYKLEYSIDAGASYQLSPMFDSLVSNQTYKIAVRSCVSGCELRSSFFLSTKKSCPSIKQVDIVEAFCDDGPIGKMTIVLSQESGISSRNYEYSIDAGQTWSYKNSFDNAGGRHTVLIRNKQAGCFIGDMIKVGCYSCYDRKRNGQETAIDCGGPDCHSCECPSMEDVKRSALLQNSTSAVQGKPPTIRDFICDRPEYHDCRVCISYRSCHDEIDNDKTIVLDCEDPKCKFWYQTQCDQQFDQCEDGLDNDKDGLLDCLDPDCNNSIYCDFVDQAGHRYFQTFNHKELSLLMLRTFKGGELLRRTGRPLWEKSFRRGTYIVTPFAHFHAWNINSMIITKMEKGRPKTYNLFTLQELLRAIDLECEEQSENDRFKLTGSLYSTVHLFCIADQKYNGGQNVRLINYLIDNRITHRHAFNSSYCLLVCDSFITSDKNVEIIASNAAEGFPGSCGPCTNFKIGKNRRTGTCSNWIWICSAVYDPNFIETTDLRLNFTFN